MNLRRSALLLPLALVLFLAADVHATITPEASAILERALKALGGRAAVDAERTVYERSTVNTFGLTGTAESWAAQPDRTAQVVHIGPINVSSGTIGDRAWRIDQNGKLHWLDGKELDQARAGAWFENGRWQESDQGGGKVRTLPDETEGGVTLDVLEVTPPMGRARRFYYDASTGLLVKIVHADDAHVLTARLSGYAQMAGLLRARDTRQSIEGMASNDLTVHVDSVAVNVAMDSTRFLPPQALGADFRFMDGGHVAKVPMSYSARHVWLKVSVNGGPPDDFLLDTGASVSVIDSAYAASHGFQVEGELEGGGAGAQGKMAFSQVQSLRVSGEGSQGVEVSNQKVVVIALNRYIAPFFWRDAAGILGYDFISRFVMTVDYQGQTLTLQDPEGYAYAGKGQAVPMTFSGNIPVVKASIDGMEGDFRLDVGSGSSVDLHAPFVKAHDLAGKVGKTMPATGGGFGGTFTVLACRMHAFTVGPYTVKDPLASLSQATAGAFASEDYAGNVGNLILDRFTCTFDYNHKQLYLEPNARFAARDPGDRAGTAIVKQGSAYTIMEVREGTPAASAGLQPNDEVLSVKGQAMEAWDQDELRKLFETAPAGKGIKIEVMRGEKKKKLKLKPQDLL